MELIKEPVNVKRRRRAADVCPALLLHHTALCDVGQRTYAPSSFQVQEFCTTDRHRRCPLRLMAPVRNGSSAEE